MKYKKYVAILVAIVSAFLLAAISLSGCDTAPTITPPLTATAESPLPTPTTVSPLPTPIAGITVTVTGKSVENIPRQLQSQEEPITMNFEEVLINGIPLLLLIIGMVQFAKEMGLSGKLLRAASALLGLAFGVAYQVSLGTPTDFAGWLGVTVYGLGLGVTASGLIDAARRIAATRMPSCS